MLSSGLWLRIDLMQIRIQHFPNWRSGSRVLMTLNREHLALQNMKILYFFYICGSFMPSWIRIQQLIYITADPCGSGSTTLAFVSFGSLPIPLPTAGTSKLYRRHRGRTEKGRAQKANHKSQWSLRTETHTKRLATQHSCLPSAGRWGQRKQLKCVKIFCTRPTRPTNQQPRKDPFQLYSLSPHSPQFQQGPPLSSLSGWELAGGGGGGGCLTRIHDRKFFFI